MMLYLILNLGSLIVPLAFSFHPKIQFYKKLNVFIPAVLLSSAIYIGWDIVFTNQGVWGFNHQYLIGSYIFGLPLEEWMFFICIPYASIFTHYTLTSLYPNLKLGSKTSTVINWIVVTFLVVLVMLNLDKAYTSINGIVTLVILLAIIFLKPKVLRSFYLTFLVILVPFFVVNGILTGSFIVDQVVWYNNAENLGIRFFTIPVEDFIYAFGMLLLTILMMEVFSGNKKLKLFSKA